MAVGFLTRKPYGVFGDEAFKEGIIITKPPSNQYDLRLLLKAERRRPDRKLWPDTECQIREPAGSGTLSYLTEWELPDPEPVI